MSKFEFLDRSINLDIAGEKFVLAYGDGLSLRVQKCINDTAQFMKEVQDGKKGDGDMPGFLRSTIDTILESDGAYERIFKNREPDVTETNDVVWYIIGEVRKKREELEETPTYQAMKAEKESGALETAKAVIVNTTQPNRATRRAAKKK